MLLGIVAIGRPKTNDKTKIKKIIDDRESGYFSSLFFLCCCSRSTMCCLCLLSLAFSTEDSPLSLSKGAPIVLFCVVSTIRTKYTYVCSVRTFQMCATKKRRKKTTTKQR